jgi:tetratricopeptide (TPR) repeat protein
VFPSFPSIRSISESQQCVLDKLDDLSAAHDWRGVMALEAEATAVADQLCDTWPHITANIYLDLARGLTERGHLHHAKGLQKKAQDLQLALPALGQEQWARAVLPWARTLPLKDLKETAVCLQGTTARQEHVLTQMLSLVKTKDWRGIVSLEDEALSVAHDLDASTNGAPFIHFSLGHAFLKLGQHAKAFTQLEQCMRIAKQSHDRDLEATVHSALGVCYESVGMRIKASYQHQQSLAINEKVVGGNTATESAGYVNLSSCFSLLYGMLTYADVC